MKSVHLKHFFEEWRHKSEPLSKLLHRYLLRLELQSFWVSDSRLHRYRGPFNQWSFLNMAFKFSPFDPSSAGLSSRFIYFFQESLDLLCITLRRSDSNVWNLFESLLIHFNTDVKSVQQQTWYFVMCNSSRMILESFTEIIAAVSSNLGIEILYTGANLVFPITSTCTP